MLWLGLFVGITQVGTTLAHWSDEATITGTSLTSGTLDLQVNNADAHATTTLGMTGMVPGSSSAEVLTIRNNGNVPLKYTLNGGLTGTGAAAYNSASALLLTIRSNGTRSGSGNAATCAGGTVVHGPAALTDAPASALIGASRGPLAPGGTESLCFQIALTATAPSSLQGTIAAASFTAVASSDVS